MVRIIDLLDAEPLTRDQIQVGMDMLHIGVVAAILARMIDRGLIVCDGDRYMLGT
jgi:predicted transcriptional regulator